MERAVWSVVLVLVWVAGAIVLTWREFVAAAVVAVPSVIVVTKTRQAISARRRVRPGWLWRLPAAVVRETFVVWRAAFLRRDLARGRIRSLRLGTGGRRVIAVLLLSAVPGVVVIEVDRTAKVARLHSLAGVERAVLG